MMRRYAFFGVSLLLIAFDPVAHAQRAPRGEWLRCVRQANEALTQGNHARALERFQCAAQIEMTPALRLSIAREHESLSHLPEGEAHRREAFDMARLCVQDATSNRTLPDREPILRACEAIADRTRSAVDAGADVPTNHVDAAVDVPPRDGPPNGFPVYDGGVTPPIPDAPPPPPSEGPGAGPWVLLGGGALIALAGGGFFIAFAQATSDRHAACPPYMIGETSAEDCAPGTMQAATAFARRDDQLLYRTLGVISLSVGLSAVAGGLLWYALAPRDRGMPRRATLRLNVAPVAGGALAGFEGVW